MGTSDLSDALSGVLTGLHRLVRRRLRTELPGPPLRGAQLDLLRLVSASPGIGVSAAARELYLAGNSVSTLVNQLTAAGLLHRETCRDDRRSARLTLTPQAEERLRAWQSRRAALLREHLDHLGEADRQALAAALPALRTLARRLHEEVSTT
jgi:DNA-binding MarR family transcriptional regulator